MALSGRYLRQGKVLEEPFAISGNQWHSVAISGTQWQLVAVT